MKNDRVERGKDVEEKGGTTNYKGGIVVEEVKEFKKGTNICSPVGCVRSQFW
jgi:hypothetical protein